MELIGFLLPPFLDILNRRISDKDARWMATVVLCSIIGIGLNVLQHNGVYDTSNWLAIAQSVGESIVAVFGAAQISYKLAWEDSGVRSELGLNAKEK